MASDMTTRMAQIQLLVRQRALTEHGHLVFAGEPVLNKEKNVWCVPLQSATERNRDEAREFLSLGMVLVDEATSQILEFPGIDEVRCKAYARILLADDELCETWQKAYSHPTRSITFVRDGEQAVKAVGRHPYDLVVLDVDMPRKNGIEAMLDIKRQQANIKGMFLTGRFSKEDVARRAKKHHVPCESLLEGNCYVVAKKMIDVANTGDLSRCVDGLLMGRGLPPGIIIHVNGNGNGNGNGNHAKGKLSEPRFQDAGRLTAAGCVAEHKPTLAELDALGELKHNWDGYGADPIDPEILGAAKKFIQSLAEPLPALPCVVPMTRGRIQLEWHRGQRSLELEFESATHVHYLKWDAERDFEEEDVIHVGRKSDISGLIAWFFGD